MAYNNYRNTLFNKKIVNVKFAIDFLIKMAYNKDEPIIGFNYLL